jgi:flagellar motor protein MotB
MTSLAVIFILLLVATLNNARQEIEGSKSQVLQRLQKVLQEFAKEGVKVEPDLKDPLALLVVVPEDLLNFRQGLSDIPENGKVFLAKFMPIFVGAACSPNLKTSISSIVVEGHASTEGDENKNLELSQDRSTKVVEKGLEVLEGPQNQANHACFLQLVSATGRGSAEPVVEKGFENRQLSRRVIFKVRIKSAEQRQVLAIAASGY